MSLIASAHAAGITGAAAGGGPSSLIFLVVIFAAFYFFLIRPQAKRAKEHRNLVSSIAKGDEIVTNGGLMGKITKVNDDSIVMTIADGVEVTIQRVAIATTLPNGTLKAV